MKKVPALFLVMVLLGAVAAKAETTGTAVARVYATVVPNIAVGVVTANVNAGSVQTGPLTATIVFRVDANQQIVRMQLAASPLFKAGDAASPYILGLTYGKIWAVVPAQGNRVGGLPNELPLDGPGPVVSGFPTIQTIAADFESSQAFVFSQEVTVTVPYTQGNPELPQGAYSGVVQFTASLI